MTCPSCKKDYNGNFDKFSIEKLKRCVDCQKEWQELPENNPENLKFRVDWSYTSEDSIIIYAKTEKDAREEFEESGENFSEYEIREVK